MFEVNTSLSGSTGTVGYTQSFDPPTFADIFSGSPLYYHGSSVEVQERMRIITNITQPQLIDRDFQWFRPKKYLGTWQITDLNLLHTWEQGKYGYLNGEVQDITFRSRYTIVSSPDTPVAVGDQIDLSTCNFYLQPDVYSFPSLPAPIPGYKAVEIFPQFIGATTYTAAPLKDTEYNQFIAGIGLYLEPGVEGISLNYSITIINDIYTDYPAYEPPTCTFLPASCQQQFSAFIAANPQFYASFATCEANNPPCNQYTWTCPSNQTTTFPYWEGTLT